MSKIRLTCDHASISRARGLLAAFYTDDRATFHGTLASDIDAGEPSALRTFYSVMALAAAAVDLAARQAQASRGEVLDDVTAAVLASLEHRKDPTTDDDDTA